MNLIVNERTIEAESERTNAEKTAYREFIVRADDNLSTVSVVAAEAAVGIDVGDGHPDDSSRKVKSVKSVYRDKQVLSVVTVQISYSTITNTFQNNPLLDQDDWSYDPDKSEEEYYKDNASTPNKSLLTNGKPLHPLPKRRKYLFTLVINRNVSEFYPASNLEAMNGYSNSDSISYNGISIGPKQGLMEATLGKRQVRNNYPFRVLTMKILIDPINHHKKYDSRDKEELSSGQLKPIMDGNGKQVSFAYPLNSDGSKASTPQTAPYEIELQPYTEVGVSGYVNRT